MLFCRKLHSDSNESHTSETCCALTVLHYYDDAVECSSVGSCIQTTTSHTCETCCALQHACVPAHWFCFLRLWNWITTELNLLK
jgi:hypothetical protein